MSSRLIEEVPCEVCGAPSTFGLANVWLPVEKRGYYSLGWCCEEHQVAWKAEQLLRESK